MEMPDYDYQEEGYGRRGSSGGLISDFLSKPLNLATMAFIVGMLFGWMVLGWMILPVNWENATPQELRSDIQEDYMRMVIDSYNLRADPALADRRVSYLGDAAPQVIQNLAQNPGEQTSQVTLNLFLDRYASGGGIASIPSVDSITGESTQPDTDEVGSTGSLLLIACVVTFVLAGALAVMYFLRRGRGRGPVERTAAMRAQDFSRQAEQTDFEAMGAERPIAQYMTTYLVGDDLFDDSFSIDSPTGEFIGECGVGIADTIGVGEPKRVSAFEVWLFDKNDIQTVTKVLMSSHIYNDEIGHNRLAAKGEPILANPDTEIVLETETLQMVVKVVDMAYGGGALPENSFFDRITLELAVWEKR